jgi:hypothetical protein
VTRQVSNEIEDSVTHRSVARDDRRWKQVDGVIPYNATFHFYWCPLHLISV